MNSKIQSMLVGTVCGVLLNGCALGKPTTTTSSQSTSDAGETAQQVGDVMASIDELGGSGGSITLHEWQNQRDWDKLVARYATQLGPDKLSSEQTLLSKLDFLNSAQAGTCSSSAVWSACAGGTSRTLTFGGCTVGTVAFAGTVSITYSASNACSLQAAGDTITRVPAFTATGRRSATLTVSKSGTNGQRIQWQSGTGASKVSNFTNDGIRRVFSSTAAGTLFDQTTATTSTITLTGTTRANRVISGGSLRVTDNLKSTYCDYVPSNVAWTTSSCNCPTSGSWSGTCSDGSSTSITMTGCGTATFTTGTTSESLSFDRCGT